MDWGLKRGKVDPSSGAYVKLRGTPYDTTKAEIKEFFEGKFCNDDDEKKLVQHIFWYFTHRQDAKVQILRFTHVFAYTNMDVDEEAYHSKLRPSSAGFCENAIITKISFACPNVAWVPV